MALPSSRGFNQATNSSSSRIQAQFASAGRRLIAVTFFSSPVSFLLGVSVTHSGAEGVINYLPSTMRATAVIATHRLRTGIDDVW